jgi:hypothetical protein
VNGGETTAAAGRLLEGQEDNAMTRSLLIAAASIAALAAPAPASALGNNMVSSVAIHSGSSGGSSHWRGGGRHFANLGCDSGRDRDRRGHGRERGGSGCALFADGWGYYDPEMNRSWDSDSYNDWWHDRPDRAFPRWVQHNEGCEPDRMWWSGGGWHC